MRNVLSDMSPTFDNQSLPIDEPLYHTLVWDSCSELRQVTHAHRDMLGAYVTGKFALDLRPDSVLWTDADSGAVASVIYGIFAPLLCGCATVIQGDSFAACYLVLDPGTIGCICMVHGQPETEEFEIGRRRFVERL